MEGVCQAESVQGSNASCITKLEEDEVTSVKRSVKLVSNSHVTVCSFRSKIYTVVPPKKRPLEDDNATRPVAKKQAKETS